MGHGPRPPLLERQTRLRAIQRLNLTLLIDAQHQGVFGWIQVKADNVVEFLGKAGIVAEFKGFLRCGFKPCACQMRRTLAALMPMTAAIERVLQCVALGGVCRVVLPISSRTCRALIFALRPGQGHPFRGLRVPARGISCATARPFPG